MFHEAVAPDIHHLVVIVQNSRERAAGSVSTPMRRANVSTMHIPRLFASSLLGPSKFHIAQKYSPSRTVFAARVCRRSFSRGNYSGKPRRDRVSRSANRCLHGPGEAVVKASSRSRARACVWNESTQSGDTTRPFPTVIMSMVAFGR